MCAVGWAGADLLKLGDPETLIFSFILSKEVSLNGLHLENYCVSNLKGPKSKEPCGQRLIERTRRVSFVRLDHQFISSPPVSPWF